MKSKILEDHICGFNDGECECECFKEAINKVKIMITEEIVIAQKEGQGTSRLTSLYNRLTSKDSYDV